MRKIKTLGYLALLLILQSSESLQQQIIMPTTGIKYINRIFALPPPKGSDTSEELVNAITTGKIEIPTKSRLVQTSDDQSVINFKTLQVISPEEEEAIQAQTDRLNNPYADTLTVNAYTGGENLNTKDDKVYWPLNSAVSDKYLNATNIRTSSQGSNLKKPTIENRDVTHPQWNNSTESSYGVSYSNALKPQSNSKPANDSSNDMPGGNYSYSNANNTLKAESEGKSKIFHDYKVENKAEYLKLSSLALLLLAAFV